MATAKSKRAVTVEIADSDEYRARSGRRGQRALECAVAIPEQN